MLRKRDYYLLKTVRTSGWLLLALMTLYLVTGFALCGRMGLNRLMDAQTALAIHQFFDWPLVAVVVVHAAITVYFAMRRWGWIRK
jgi:hypothetical protein